jgi:hypothetical protein
LKGEKTLAELAQQFDRRSLIVDREQGAASLVVAACYT